jgi:multiple sugar transport system permease protein
VSWPLARPLQGAAVQRRPRAAAHSRARRDNRAAYLFLLPWFAGLALLTLGPMVASLYLSFTRYDLLSPPEWIGGRNYQVLFTRDGRFAESLRVTFTYVVLSVPLKLLFALAVAMVLNTGLRGLSVYRAVYYVPSLLGGSVAIALLWRRVFGGDGLINRALGALGFTDLPSWIATPDYALYPLVILAVWQFGSPMIIFLAGLKQIPTDLYEAAAVDGAGRLSQFFRITLPLLTPIVFFNLVLQMIGAFQAFTPAFVVSGGSGGPSDATLFYTLYLYQQGFGNLKMGYASAMAWVLLVIIAAFTAVNFLSSRFWVHYGDER